MKKYEFDYYEKCHYAYLMSCIDAIRTLCIMLCPMAPHIASELWDRLSQYDTTMVWCGIV